MYASPQLDILRGIHADLNALAQEVNHLLGFQILVHIITSVIFAVMFGYFFSASMIDKEFYWPYLVLFLLPCLRILLIGHWGQVLEHQVRRNRKKPFRSFSHANSFPVSPTLFDYLSSVHVGRLGQAGAPGAEIDHPNAPPVSATDRGRILLTRQKHDPEGTNALTSYTTTLFISIFPAYSFRLLVWPRSSPSSW